MKSFKTLENMSKPIRKGLQLLKMTLLPSSSKGTKIQKHTYGLDSYLAKIPFLNTPYMEKLAVHSTSKVWRGDILPVYY